MTNNISQLTNAALVDALGALKAQQSDLAAQEKKLKEQLTSRMSRTGGNELEGNLFRVCRVSAVRETLDAAEVKRLLANPPMKSSIVRSFRVSARKAVAA